MALITPNLKTDAMLFEKHRDSSGNVYALRIGLNIRDSVIPEIKWCEFWIDGAEYQGLPAGATARRLAIRALGAQKIQLFYDNWIKNYLPTTLVGDPNTEL